MKVVTLMENEACRSGLAARRGLSLYIETKRHKILFDMGPDEAFAANAKALGVDLSQVDVAVLSHGHSDHGDGLSAFCARNDRADVFARGEALGSYYAVLPGQEPQYIGLAPLGEEEELRIVPTAMNLRLGEELTLLSEIPQTFAFTPHAPKLQEKTAEGFVPDAFFHEQHLLVQSDGKAVLFAGCAHGGIVNIVRAAEKKLKRLPDAVFGGFHLFELDPADPKSEELLSATAAELRRGKTVYYTGHCTGDYAYGRLKEVLGDRLQPIHAGSVVTL